MKKNDRSIRKLPSPETIEAACSGDALAIEQILLHYNSYINKLCLRVVQDDSRQTHVQVDSYMKGLLQNKLIRAITNFSLRP